MSRHPSTCQRPSEAEGGQELAAMERMTHFELLYHEPCWSLLEDGAWPER
jgi:hypothetical protein